jgi:hypothetical protein
MAGTADEAEDDPLEPRKLHDRLHCILVNTDLDYESIDALHELVEDIALQHKKAMDHERAEAATVRKAEADAVRTWQEMQKKDEARSASFTEQTTLLRDLSRELVRSQEQMEKQVRLEYEHRLAELEARLHKKRVDRRSVVRPFSGSASVVRPCSGSTSSNTRDPSTSDPPSGASSHYGV